MFEIDFSNNKKCVDIQKDGIKALKPDWNKIDKVQYQQEIEEKLDNLPLNIDSPAHIDMAYTEVNTLIHNAITTVAPRKKSTKRKPKLKVMNEEK
jgi:hypothetical protein